MRISVATVEPRRYPTPPMRRLLMLLAAFAVWSVPAVPGQAQFIVNTYTDSDQVDSSGCTDADGNFVIVWTSVWCSNCTSQDGDESGVYGQRFARDGARLGGEFQIHQQIAGRQYGARVACAADGTFMVVWLTQPFDMSGRLFDRDGVPLGDEFPLEGDPIDGDWHHHLAIDHDAAGNFIVAWDRGRTALGSNVFLRRFRADGSPAGVEMQVSQLESASTPALTCRAGGDCVLAWSVGAEEGIVARRWSAADTPLGEEIQVSSGVFFTRYDPVVEVDPSGGFVIAWDNDDWTLGPLHRAALRRFDSNGEPLGPEIQVGTDPGLGWDPSTWGAYGTALALADDGGFLIGWSGMTGGETESAQFAQRFSSAGVPEGAPFRLNRVTPSIQTRLRALQASADRLVLTWTSGETNENSTYDIMAGFCHLDASAVCPDTPQSDCAPAASAKLRLRRDADGTRNKLDWDWTAAADVAVESFGFPDLAACGASYALCVYEESQTGSRLVASTTAARGGDCAGRPCWTRNRSGFKYRDRRAAKTTLRLRSGSIGRATIGARSKGADVLLPTTARVTAQAVRSGGTCWTSTFEPADVRLANATSFLATR